MARRYYGAYVYRARCWTEKGEFDKAITDYTAALESSPTDTEIWAHRADAWVRTCALDKAVRDYTKAIEMQPQSAGVYRALAFIHACSPDIRHRNAEQAVSLA